MKKSYKVIVVGGGHAGAEAAAASARLGANTLLITLRESNLGEMSCNPAIGGIAKGILVKEVDALDGLMARMIDKAGIHYKMLNESKGPAVWGPRAQADRSLYKKAVKEELINYPNLDIIYDSVEDIVIENDSVVGVVSNNSGIINCNSLVLTTGTFLAGMIHVGNRTTPAGRVGEEPSNGLSNTLKRIRFNVSRLKTGTPARIDGATIDFSKLEPQPGDLIPRPFSEMTERILVPQISCFITSTNNNTHRIINDNLSKSAMYSGQIEGVGPRYCPSIEDKVVRFSSKSSHQIFLEPEGLNDTTIYPNGLSTSLPEDVQEAFIHSIKGLENCKIIRCGYAIEYDFVDPRELKHSLETKKIRRLYFAGQINGTTGYEEAAGQGIVAGINAALSAQNKQEFILTRADSYIGVMIDDLVTLGTSEPYRMFTSRSEYRLSIRADNADQRLTQKGVEIGLVSKEREKRFYKKLQQLEEAKVLLSEKILTTTQLKKFGISVSQDGSKKSAYQMLGLPKIGFEKTQEIFPELKKIDQKILNYIYIESKYSSYLERQNLDIKMFIDEEILVIPGDIDYTTIKSLSNEVIEKLKFANPLTLGAARRIPGITPAAIMSILIHIKTADVKR
ncbi:MAG: tRNA uridine-5-carboxymethylaminomethyl(34) synthesis enzyme MnmG [Rickettsiales bacterium]|nr:tRNA uridine-5-carboxymethylaminomethyl(34) synthesis enzyme MnmG [Rickettsiales bacterium]MCA0254271.1 tRNA uridine-5-carboxymethylaminomethyl(34) synthesis enzyme MnmG [Pseudomonadota bacterium]